MEEVVDKSVHKVETVLFKFRIKELLEYFFVEYFTFIEFGLFSSRSSTMDRTFLDNGLSNSGRLD